MLMILAALICAVAGLFSGLLGLGGGLILVPMFHYVLKMSLHLSIGTSLAVIIPTAITGAIKHSTGGNVDWRIVFFASVFAVVGSLIGATVSMNMDVTILRRAFSVLMVLVAVKMFFQ